MASFPRPTVSNRGFNTNTHSGTSHNLSRSICLVVSLTCFAGFFVDVLVLGTPLDPFTPEWRVSFLRQAGDRSIVLFFGAALLLYSIFDNTRLKRSLSLFCLALGVAFLLSSLVVIHDSLTLKDQAFRSISNQEAQLQTGVEESQADGSLPSDISLDQALQQISARAEEMKQSTGQEITKAGTSSLGNLGVVGLGLIGLGRVGLKKG